MEELVDKLANLQVIRKEFEVRADNAVHSKGHDRNIHDLKEELKRQIEFRNSIRRPFEEEIAKIDEGIEDISNQILYAWDGEKKTVVCDAGTLKFRTSQSLKIHDATLTLTGLLDHTSVADVAKNYIKGFNLTAVKKYMGVLALPQGAAEIEQNTTVKLEV